MKIAGNLIKIGPEKQPKSGSPVGAVIISNGQNNWEKGRRRGRVGLRGVAWGCVGVRGGAWVCVGGSGSREADARLATVAAGVAAGGGGAVRLDGRAQCGRVIGVSH
jgi:hypothetical protein